MQPGFIQAAFGCTISATVGELRGGMKRQFKQMKMSLRAFPVLPDSQSTRNVPREV